MSGTREKEVIMSYTCGIWIVIVIVCSETILKLSPAKVQGHSIQAMLQFVEILCNTAHCCANVFFHMSVSKFYILHPLFSSSSTVLWIVMTKLADLSPSFL